jgi:hypothetical protein
MANVEIPYENIAVIETVNSYSEIGIYDCDQKVDKLCELNDLKADQWDNLRGDIIFFN